MDLSNLTDSEIRDLVIAKKVGIADFIDSGICPTCFNRRNNEILYGDNSDKIIYEDELFECFLVGNPRAIGHTAISTKVHYKDMSEVDSETNMKIMDLARRLMIVLKNVYGPESVYLCTMCDGPMNHFHVQLIPRYSYEKRGSRNFVKPRKEYVHDEKKVKSLRKFIVEEVGK